MKYENILEGIFLDRPNRFTADIIIDGEVKKAHVINTGRCRELLMKGNTVYLVHKTGESRKTEYDLVTVKRSDGKLINMDSYAPNRMAGEWIKAGGLGNLTELKAEQYCGESRYDFTANDGNLKTYIEIKGCTLERDGIAYFPDAPTARGKKHVEGLTQLACQGFRCVVLIVIQMEGVKEFRPNRSTDPAFSNALVQAARSGVEIVAVECRIVPGQCEITRRIPVMI